MLIVSTSGLFLARVRTAFIKQNNRSAWVLQGKSIWDQTFYGWISTPIFFQKVNMAAVDISKFAWQQNDLYIVTGKGITTNLKP